MSESEKYPAFYKNKSNFYQCSYDDSNHEYMQVVNKECINFDQAVADIVNSLKSSKDAASSCDALAWNKNDPVLIEFKNGRISDKVKSNIRGKMCNSVLMLEYAFDERWIEMRKKLHFVLVYNAGKNPVNPKDEMHEAVYNLAAGTRNVRFGIEKAYGLYFSSIRTLNEEEFNHFVEKNELHI